MEPKNHPIEKENHLPSTSIFVASFEMSFSFPIGSMYGIFTYIWLIFIVNVGQYTSPMDPMGFGASDFFFHVIFGIQHGILCRMGIRQSEKVIFVSIRLS